MSDVLNINVKLNSHAIGAAKALFNSCDKGDIKAFWAVGVDEDGELRIYSGDSLGHPVPFVVGAIEFLKLQAWCDDYDAD